jgi:hypothetical protein
MLTPCPGCGALFPESDGPTHRYVGSSAGCWALFCSLTTKDPDLEAHVSTSHIPKAVVQIPAPAGSPSLDAIFGDAYAVQHHGHESPQAIQSVAVHLLDLHGIISGRTTQPLWSIARALRRRGVFHKLTPPPLGGALTIRHLFPAGGVLTPVTQTQYVLSVYEAWMSLHRSTVHEWYERYVLPDQLADDGGPDRAPRQNRQGSRR